MNLSIRPLKHSSYIKEMTKPVLAYLEVLVHRSKSEKYFYITG